MFCEPIRRALQGLAVLGIALAAAPAQALDPDRAIGHFTHVWYENQLPQGTVLSITQRADGSMWLATYGGLVHHSGAGFNTIDPRLEPALKSSAITAVSADPDGTLWVGTLNGGLYRRSGRELEPVALPSGVESIFGIVTDRDSALWLTTNAGVVRVVGGVPQLLGEQEGFPPRGFYRAIVADPAGGVWIAADGLGVVRWHSGQVEVYDQDRGLPSNAVYSLTMDAAGVAWAGTQDGPAFFTNGRFQRDPRASALDDDRVYSIHGDRDGNVWFAPLDKGICRLSASRFDCDETLKGMRGETVRSMFQDHEGSLWIGTTSSGIHRLSQSKLITVTGQMASNAVRAVHQDASGALWVGTDGAGLARYQEPGLVPAAAYNAKLPSQLVRAIETTADGHLWVAGTEGVTRFKPDGSARSFGIGDGLPGTIAFAFAPAQAGGLWTATLQGVARIVGDTVEPLEATRGDDARALYEDPGGRLWIGLRSGLRCLYKGVLDRCGTDGLPGSSVFAFHPSDNGDLWLGTSVGLVRVRDGVATRYLQRAGFHGDAVFAILDDGLGHFWVSSNRGIARLAKTDLAALDQDENAVMQPAWYGVSDGMLNAQANGASQTPARRSRDGRLWFGTANGVVVVDPANVRMNLQAPSVQVERLLVDGADVDPGNAGRLGPGVERIELQFAAMSYVAPSAVRYRFRMEGYDSDWSVATAGRSASYTNLPPGDYVFRVAASNNDGVWNESGASLAFTLVPRWHQTTWFRLIAALALLGIIGAGVWFRLRGARRRERELTREVAQRTDALREANEQLVRIAALDALTGIANRREFNRQFLQAWHHHAARSAPLAVLIADIDSFKHYNDTYGHLEGDAALAAVAGAIAGAVRGEADLAARYGGEEFAVLLPDCGPDQAMAVAQKMLDAVRALGIAHRASDAAGIVTLSVGVASLVPPPGGQPDGVLRAADVALYRAKDEGRNRAILS
ncbi:MAG: diguanylate cyclase [Arenimonas sp.]|uniref:two-component regulator propeller domain-containing protein n=1 Tax=Arenimonas sp. TaxID=1872635 RepID=UPI0025B7E442|nr:two-component regulator propeller domain-containing protein [Arenimonas sp.]MBW8369318.1 diguanylate cyclase [Arenimonas sp.]